jgi:hypothetical protein
VPVRQAQTRAAKKPRVPNRSKKVKNSTGQVSPSPSVLLSLVQA